MTYIAEKYKGVLAEPIDPASIARAIPTHRWVVFDVPRDEYDEAYWNDVLLSMDAMTWEINDGKIVHIMAFLNKRKPIPEQADQYYMGESIA